MVVPSATALEPAPTLNASLPYRTLAQELRHLRTRTYTRAVVELDDNEYRQCYRLNLGKWGSMRWQLQKARRHDDEAWSYLIKDLDTGKLIAWALVFVKNRKWCAHFYVREKYRRMGYGTRLVDYVKRDFDNVKIEPWSKQAGKFFKSQGYKVPKWTLK